MKKTKKERIEVPDCISIPDIMVSSRELINGFLLDDISYFSIPSHGSKSYMKLKILTIGIEMLLAPKGRHTQLFELSKKEFLVLSNAEKTANLDIALDFWYAYKQYCIERMQELRNYGWTEVENTVFGDTYENAYENYRNTRLKFYYEYFDELVDEEKQGAMNFSEVYIYVNKRLGQYKTYCASHSVDKTLSGRIDVELSRIIALFGTENCVNRNAEDGFEIVYIHTYLEMDCEYEECIFTKTDFLLPIHAYNLEKLLDKAFELYPIEKEVQDDEKRVIKPTDTLVG